MSLATGNRSAIEISPRIAEKIILQGHLQGMGTRPAIYRLAADLDLVGEVRNTIQGVEIVVEGPAEQIYAFQQRLHSQLPVAADIVRESRRLIPVTTSAKFTIVHDGSWEPIAATVPQDVAVCRRCLEEVHDVRNRRFHYPFNSCASCGPRYSIIRQMPFDREDTAMAEFPWCDDCQAEYRTVDDRRFHAQTISCPQCGPRLWSVTAGGRICRDQEKTIELAGQALRHGLIVALKGLGGYQLLVDATNRQAVDRLRLRKGRPSKPLAVMVRSLADAERLAALNRHERQALKAASNPIVLLDVKQNSGLAPAIHPGLSSIGLLLPTTALHDLLLQRVERPLVCTSGNREGDPLAFDVEEAETNLADICDLWLHHNRLIVRPIDDSVVRVIGEKCVTMRLARGMAPLRLRLDAFDAVIALGGHQKSSMAWSNGGIAFLGPHIGDLDRLAVQQRYAWHQADWRSLYRISPLQAVHDSHPGYFTTQSATGQFSQVHAVQHHHAHVAAAMLEHQLVDQSVLGVAWDGTGYGSDGAVWGGEFLIAKGSNFERFAHLAPFFLPGGEVAIREPWRVVVSLLSETNLLDQIPYLESLQKQREQVPSILRILDNRRFSPITTSAGRLFDGAACLILNRERSEYEGQLAMLLEAIADPKEAGAYELAIREREPLELDWRPLVRQLLEDLVAGISPGRMSMRFHRGLAHAILAVCGRRPELPVVLTGGVFQNRLLTELVADIAAEDGRLIYLPGAIPPGDGGLAAGQLTLALNK